MQYQMTPEHAATQLLALEPLSFSQLRVCAGWDHEKTRAVTNTLLQAGTITQHTDQIYGCRFWVTDQLEAYLARARRRNVTRQRGQPALRRVA